MPQQDNLVALFRKGLNNAKKQQKSDAILDFIRQNWRLFCSSKRLLEDQIELLEQQEDLSVTALSEALGIPDSILFKKVKVVDTAKMILKSSSNPIYNLFMEQVAKRTPVGKHEKELCLILVAGAHTMIITNMRTKRVPGLVHLTIPGEEGHEDVNIFHVSDAVARLPELFTPEN